MKKKQFLEASVCELGWQLLKTTWLLNFNEGFFSSFLSANFSLNSKLIFYEFCRRLFFQESEYVLIILHTGEKVFVKIFRK